MLWRPFFARVKINYRSIYSRILTRVHAVAMATGLAGFSLTFEVEGHWLVSRQVPCKTEGRRPEPLRGSGGMLPQKIFRT